MLSLTLCVKIEEYKSVMPRFKTSYVLLLFHVVRDACTPVVTQGMIFIDS